MRPVDKILCPVYGVSNTAYACAKRYFNAHQGRLHPYDIGGPGSNDPACKDCDIGRELFEQGAHLNKNKGDKMPEKVVVNMVTCEGCQKPKAVKEMGIHPVSKKPWKLCPECRSSRMKAGQAKKKKTVSENPVPSPPVRDEKKCDVLTVNFAMYPDLLEGLKRCAVDEYRTPEQQIMLFIDQGLSGFLVANDD